MRAVRWSVGDDRAVGYPLVAVCLQLDYITSLSSRKLRRGNFRTAAHFPAQMTRCHGLSLAGTDCKFEQEFPEWRIELIKPIMPFRYLLSGGVSLRSLAPAWSFKLWDRLENTLGRLEQPTGDVCADSRAAFGLPAMNLLRKISLYTSKLKLPLAYLVPLALISPSLVWIALDKSVWQ